MIFKSHFYVNVMIVSHALKKQLLSVNGSTTGISAIISQ